MTHPSLLAALVLLLAATPAMAQLRPFNCFGAERLEDDVFEVPFANGRAELRPDSLRTPLAAIVALARAEPDRNICVLGHSRQEGGQTTGTQLAARRARAVALALSADGGIERDRIRAEARNPGFSRSAAAAQSRRAVTVVVLPPQQVQPVPQAAPEPPAPESRAPEPAVPEPAAPESAAP